MSQNAMESDDFMTSSTSSSLGYRSTSSLIETPPLCSLISDAGTFSLCGLVAMSFHRLFPDPWDSTFCENTLLDLIRHLQLPGQCVNSMRALMSGEGGDIDTFIKLIKKEETLQCSCVRVIEELILFAVKEGVYDSRLRVLILYVAELLNVPLQFIELYEESVVEMLSEEIPEQTNEELKLKERRERNKKFKRYFMIGLASVGGGAIIGLTGGLAAPVFAAGAGALIGAAGSAVLGSSAGIAVIGSLFGVAGAGLTGYKMKKRVGDIEEFAFDTLTQGRELHLTIAISGWVNEEGPEAFQMRYESAYLLELGRAMDYLLSFAVSYAAQEALKFTILSGIIAAIAWPATLVTVTGVIDNPWGVCLRRSAEVGKHLADILCTRQQGKRPVTLIGFSLGARVIFYCLQEMAQRKGCEGIIHDAIMLGTPVSAAVDQWKPLARIVSGRIINGYCRGDWLLKYLYRTSSATFRIAGLQAVDWDNRRLQNIDLSDIVTGHMDYSKKMTEVLLNIGIRTNEDITKPTECHIRKCVSDLPHMGTLSMAHKSTLRASKSDSSLFRRFSQDSDRTWKNIERRSSSLESILSKLSASSGGALSPVNAPVSCINKSPSFQKSSENLLNIPA